MSTFDLILQLMTHHPLPYITMVWGFKQHKQHKQHFLALSLLLCTTYESAASKNEAALRFQKQH